MRAARSCIANKLSERRHGSWRRGVNIRGGQPLRADVEAFLDPERERYAPQLKPYAEAITDSRQGLYQVLANRDPDPKVGDERRAAHAT